MFFLFRNEVVVSWLAPATRSSTKADDKVIGYILYKTFKPPTSNQLKTDEITLNASSFGSGTAYAQVDGLKQGVYYQFSVSAINSLHKEGPRSVMKGYRHDLRRGNQADITRGAFLPFLPS